MTLAKRVSRINYARTMMSFVAVLLTASQLFGQFEITWFTIDGGGAMGTTGGSFALSGTAGQPDAGSFTTPMTGGDFSLVGGFWSAASSVCTCPGDMNSDTQKNGLDIQLFAHCLVAGGACGCAEVDGVPGVNSGDVSIFVNDLLAGTACP